MRFVVASIMAATVLSQAVHAAAPNMREGMWEITMKMEMAGMPGGMPPQVMKQCMTKKDVENPQRLAQGGPTPTGLAFPVSIGGRAQSAP